jgi:hypothetical protein
MGRNPPFGSELADPPRATTTRIPAPARAPRFAIHASRSRSVQHEDPAQPYSCLTDYLIAHISSKRAGPLPWSLSSLVARLQSRLHPGPLAQSVDAFEWKSATDEQAQLTSSTFVYEPIQDSRCIRVPKLLQTRTPYVVKSCSGEFR